MKTLLKILVWGIGVLVALIIVLMIGARLFFPVEKAKAYAIEKGSSALGRPIGIDDVSLSFWGGLGVKLDKVTVGNPSGFDGTPFLQANYIDIKLQFLPLLSKSIRIDRFVIDRPLMTMAKAEDGQNNFSFVTIDSALPAEAKSIPAETKAAAAAVSFEKLEIRDGHISYRNDSSGVALELSGVQLNTAMENPRPGVYVSSGRVEVDSVSIRSMLSLPTLSLGLNYRATYDLEQKHLSVERADFNIAGLRFELGGDLYHPDSNFRAQAKFKTESIPASEVLKMLPPQRLEQLKSFRVSGDFAIDASVDYSARRVERPFEYSATAVITNMLLAKKDMGGELKFKRAIVDVKTDNVRMSIQEGMFDGRPLKGSFVVTNFKDPAINGELAGYIDFVFLKPFLPVTDRHELSGQARFDVKFNGRIKDPRNMDFSGDVEVMQGRYSSRFLPEPLDTFGLDAYFDRKLVSVRTLTARSRSADLKFTGRIDNLIAWILADSNQVRDIHPGLDGELTGELDLAALNSVLPQKRQPVLSGRLSFDLSVIGNTGDLENIRPRGRLVVNKASYSDALLPEPITQLDADLALTPDTITVNKLAVRFESSDASFSGQLAKPFPYLLPLKNLDRSKMSKPFFAFRLSSHRFDSDKLFPEAVPGSGAVKLDMPLDSLRTIIVPDVDGQGTFEIDTLVYSKIDFTAIKGKMKIYNRKIDCYDVTARAYTGTIAGKTTIDLTDFEKPRYIGEFQATQIEANDFISRFSKFGGFLFGKIDFGGHYDAVGWEPQQFLQSLSLTGVGGMQEGKLVTSGALFTALKSIIDQTGQPFSQEQALRSLKSNIAIKDGKVVLDQFRTSLGSVGDVQLGGYYGFNDEIGYTGSILLTRELTQGLLGKGGLLGGLASLATDQKTQRINVPIRISGTVTNPKAELDMSILNKKATEGVKQNVGDFLQGLIKKK